jgi:hypothetical protein
MDVTLFLFLGPSKNGIDALFFGIVNKTARVYDYNLGIALIRFVFNLKRIGLELSHHDLAIEDVLGAS